MDQVIKLNLCVKRPEQGVNYIPYSKADTCSTFLIKNIQKEVVKLNKRKKKIYKQICQTTIATSGFLFMLVRPVLAATGNPTTIMPSDIAKVGMYLIGICTAASVVLAILLTQLAGGYRMLRKGKEATEWTTDILKGLTQVLLAPVLIITITLVMILLFGNFEWFVKPF
ncbi:hypothetical protein V1503_18990 [Bacillus sp. SCS-151]|uniref:hypothetical protein n=1 Tax=Nanhaiella sioensis TaxID=3115293 RepID=UPI003978D259